MLCKKKCRVIQGEIKKAGDQAIRLVGGWMNVLVCERQGRDLQVVWCDIRLPHSYPLWGGVVEEFWWCNSDALLTLSFSSCSHSSPTYPLPMTELFYLCCLASAHVCECVHVLRCFAATICVPVSTVLIGVTGLESERARQTDWFDAVEKHKASPSGKSWK